MNKGNKKQTTITVRCTEKEKNEIECKSKENNMTASAYLRTRGITSDRTFNKSALQKRMAKELCELQSIINDNAKSLCEKENARIQERIARLWMSM